MSKVKNLITKDKLLLTVAIIWLAVIILPVVVACGYAVPSSDDFSLNISWPNGESGLLILMLQRVKNLYLTWQGPFFSNFIVAFPLFRIFGVTGLRIFLTLNAIAFFVAFILLVNEVCYWIDISEHTRTIATVLLSAIMLGLLITGNYEDEIFYWHTGACAYTVPLTVSMLCVSCFLSYERKESKKCLVTGCILAVLGGGVS